MYDVQRVRDQFPALLEGAAHFDGPGGSQTPTAVADAVAATLVSSIANRGDITAASMRADKVVLDARAAMADLLGADAGGVVFGRSMTQLTLDFAKTLAKEWKPDDEIIVSRLDHDANVRPWIHAANLAGATVRWIEFDPATGELDPDAVSAVLSDRTRLVAVCAASNLIGTRPDIAEIGRRVHAAGALLYVDGVHYTPHALVDVAALGADFYVCSPYKFFGPHLGVLAAAPALLETLWPDKLLPATDDVPERFEYGTLPYELLAGTTATVDVIAGLCPDAAGPDASRRARIAASTAASEEHEDALRLRIEQAIAAMPGTTIYSRASRRTPTLLVTFDGIAAQDVTDRLARANINAPSGSFYALEPSQVLGLGYDGGLRIGLAPYNDDNDADRLLDVLASVTGRA